MSRGQVAVLGAGSQIGVFLVPRLLAQGFGVLAVRRGVRPAGYPDFEQVRWQDAEALDDAMLSDVQMLVSTGPISLAARLVPRSRNLQRAVVFSTSSVYSKFASPDPAEQAEIRHIVKQESELGAVCASRGIDLCLLRPTLIYGCGMDGTVSWLARWIRRFGFMPVAGTAAGLRQPVHGDDLAMAAVAALVSPDPLGLEVPLCGGSTLSFRDMVVRIFTGLGRPVRILSVPPGLFATVTRLGRIMPGLGGVRPEMVRRQAVDLVFDDARARAVLAHRPRPFEPGPTEFELPAAERLRRLAGLADA